MKGKVTFFFFTNLQFLCFVFCHKYILGLKYDTDFDDSNLCWHGRGYKVSFKFLFSGALSEAFKKKTKKN